MSNKVGNIKAAQRLKSTAAKVGENSNGQRPSVMCLWATVSTTLEESPATPLTSLLTAAELLRICLNVNDVIMELYFDT